ncbi:MAG: S-layer homology domain-containing protein [bacterium]|nr:S-layer homology domain-containing protein [bacterium]
MPLIARQRSRLAVLAVLALVGSLLAVSAVPAVAAADDTADEKAMYSACVGAATEDAGFTDMDSSFAADEANCLAHYGITLGTGNSMFSPNMGVTRLQMARFLSRAAGPAGIDTMGVESQGLTDIADMSEEAQEAVNTVAHLGIMTARADDTFDPAGIVSRRDMAVHLAAFLSAALVGPGGVDIDDLKNGRASGDTPFTDISEVSVSAHKAIRDVFELGVTTGKTDTTFAPNDPVSREQMAAFITRALAHTNARPAGISVQGATTGDTEETGHELQISVRDEKHQPEPDALVDVISTSEPDEAFDDEGACVSKNVTGNCTISTGDYQTDPDGNTDGATVTLPDSAGTLTVMVWTGEVGDKFDNDSTDFASIEIDAALPADMIKVTDDTKAESDFLKFGDTVTYTLQVVNEEGDPVAEEDLAVTIRSVITDTTTGVTPVRANTVTSEAVHKTDAAGRIEVSFSEDDPDGDKDNQDTVTLTLTLTRTGDPALDITGVNDQDTRDVDEAANIQAIWSDADAVATSLTLSQRVKYHETNDDGVSNSLMATLVDQYGDPVRSQKVAVWSDAENPVTGPSEGLGRGSAATDTSPAGPGSLDDPADRRTTSRKGVATKTYTRSATAPDTETLNAHYIRIVGCDDAANADAEETCFQEDGVTAQADDVPIPADETVSHYWAQRVDSDTASGPVLVADKDNNSIVITATVDGVTGPWLVTYKAGDQFTVDGGATKIEGFEKALRVADSTADPVVVSNVAATIGDDEDDVNTFTLTTS